MRPTGSLESVTTRRCSKRNRGVTSPAEATVGVTTRSRARAGQESKSVARTKTGEGKKKAVKIDGISQPERAKEKKVVKIDGGCSKKAKLDGISQPESSKKGKSVLQPSQDTFSWEDEEEEEDYEWTDPSAASSPIRVVGPLDSRPDDDADGDSEIAKQQRARREAFHQKMYRQWLLPTIFPNMPSNCLVDDPKLLHIREPATKTVLRAAQFVVGMSSTIDGVALARCTGFWIDFDREKKTGTVVTSALLIRTRQGSENPWLCKDQYNTDAKVNVQLRGYRGYNKVDGNLLYYQKHYNLAFFRVTVDRDDFPFFELPSFNDKVKCAQDIFELGRDDFFDLLINHGKVEYSNPDGDERYHLMYIQGPQRDCMDYIGGPAIDLDGKVVGMIGTCSRGSFIPSSILLKCFQLWRNFKRIRRPHLGLKFSAISLLNPAQVEKIMLECEIDEGLVVHEVSHDSCAEDSGIRNGDVIECINGERVSTTVELENMLLSIMENLVDGFNYLDLEVQVYLTRREVRRTKELTVNVSEDGEYCSPYCATP